MRHRGPSKQRLWLGSRRHLCCGRRGHTNADAHCHSDVNSYSYSYSYSYGNSNSNSNSNCHSHGNCNRIADSHTATNPNPQSRAISKAAPHAFAQALDFALPKIPGGSVTGLGNRL